MRIRQSRPILFDKPRSHTPVAQAFNQGNIQPLHASLAQGGYIPGSLPDALEIGLVFECA